MIRLLQLDGSPSSQGLLRALALGILFCTGPVALLHSQMTTSASSDQTLPPPPASSAPQLVPRFPQAPVAPFGDASGLSSLSGVPEPTGFSATAPFSGQAFDANRRGSSSQNPLGSFAVRGNEGAAPPLFPTGAQEGSRTNRFGPTPFALPSLSRTLQRSTPLPPGSDANSLKLSSKDALRFGSLFDDSTARFSTTTMFTNSNLGNGVMFSAGTDFGSHRTVGAPVAGAGPSGTSKQSGASLAFKLSF